MVPDLNKKLKPVLLVVAAEKVRMAETVLAATVVVRKWSPLHAIPAEVLVKSSDLFGSRSSHCLDKLRIMSKQIKFSNATLSMCFLQYG